MKPALAFLKKLLTHEYLSLVLRLYIGWVFIYASLGKITDPAIFAENVANYRVVPFWGLNLVAIFLPWLELVCGFCLIIGLWTRANATLLGGLLALFTVFVIITIFRGTQMNCGCFDNVGEPVGWKKVAENTLWLLMTVQIFFFDRTFQLHRTAPWFRKKRPLLTSDI